MVDLVDYVRPTLFNFYRILLTNTFLESNINKQIYLDFKDKMKTFKITDNDMPSQKEVKKKTNAMCTVFV